MQNQIDIRPLIRDLLDLNDKTNQEDISSLRRFSLAFLNNRAEVRKALRNRIKTWNVILDKYYEQSKNSSELLTHLKEIAKSLITSQKTNLLRNLLEREGFAEDASFKKAVKRTEEMLTRIINGRCYFEFSRLNFDFKTAPDMSSINKELMASVTPSEPISISLQNVFPADHFDVSKELLMSRVEGMSPEKDDTWFRKLAPTLVDIEDVNQFNAVVAKLTFHQIIVLIQDYARAKNGVMILKLLKASKDDMVLEVLRSIKDKDASQPVNEITLINAAIDEVKDLALIQSTFGYIREIFVAKINSFTPDINLVAKKLREIKKAENITSFHILSIASFRKPIEDLQATNVAFLKLVEKRGHIVESATFHMPEKIHLTCQARLARVTNDALSRKERDNLYSILAELSYGDSDKEDDDISGALGDMGLNDVNEFIKLGVNVNPVPPKSDNDSNASNRLQEETTKRYCQIYKYFEELGIKTIGDLIDKNIYNYEQLKNYVRSHANKPVSIPSSALKS